MRIPGSMMEDKDMKTGHRTGTGNPTSSKPALARSRRPARTAPRQLDRRRRAQVVEHRAVAVDGLLHPLDGVVRSRTVDDHGSDDALEAGPRRRVDAEEAAQILFPVQLYLDGTEGNAESVGVEAPRDVLAGRESGKHNFARLRSRVGAAEPFRLVDGQSEIADLHGAAKSAVIFRSEEHT